MKKTVYVIISDVLFKLTLQNPRIEDFYESFIHQPDENAAEIEVGDDLFSFFPGESNKEAELFWHSLLICDYIVKDDKFVFHGCAFQWKGKAYIFAGPSGVGKTTQFMLWKKLFGDEISILNGDKPIIDFKEEGIFVCPSPWRGKEKLGEMQVAPLGGIIWLNQAKENRVERMAPKDAVMKIFEQVLFSYPDAETIHAVAKLTEKILNSVKLWRFDNMGDEASAILCHDTLEGSCNGEKV